MKTLLSISLLLVGTFARAQTTIKFTFVDACTNSVVYPTYQLLGPKSTLYTPDSHGVVIDQSGSYMILVMFERAENIVGWSEIQQYSSAESYSDTIVLPRIMTLEKPLHDSTRNNTYYYCEVIADGLLIDTFPNGGRRMEGRFDNGIPGKKLTYYDESGNLIKTEVYRLGKYKKTVHKTR